MLNHDVCKRLVVYSKTYVLPGLSYTGKGAAPNTEQR